jgi:hypothetical protein
VYCLARVPLCPCALVPGAVGPLFLLLAQRHCTAVVCCRQSSIFFFAGNRKGTWETEYGPIATGTPPCPAPDPHGPSSLNRPSGIFHPERANFVAAHLQTNAIPKLASH